MSFKAFDTKRFIVNATKDNVHSRMFLPASGITVRTRDVLQEHYTGSISVREIKRGR